MQPKIELPIFKIRCSSIGKIMSEPQGKSIRQRIADLNTDMAATREKLAATKPTLKTYTNLLAKIEKIEAQLEALEPLKDAPHLSRTCISHLESWVSEFMYGRKIEFDSKQTRKGNAVEYDALIYASGHIPEMGIPTKNEVKKFDDWMNGTADLVSDDYIFDNKASYSHATFPLYSMEIPETDYYWQVLGYMALYGKKKGRVVYTLMSMPDEMIRKEAKWILGPEYTQSEYEAFAAKFQYEEIPAYLRIKQFEVYWDEDQVQAIRSRVEQCRQYIQENIVPAIEMNMAKYSTEIQTW